jgi:hypothetical protein
MMRHHPDICQRDDGLWSIGHGDNADGPFPSRAFAMQVASGNRPEPAPAARSRHFKVIREVHRDGP